MCSVVVVLVVAAVDGCLTLRVVTKICIVVPAVDGFDCLPDSEMWLQRFVLL